MAASYHYFADDLGTELVTLFVGPERRKFVVHRALLVSQSSYFKGALATNLFREAVEGVITFEEDDPDAFRLLVSWAYQRRIPRVQPFITKPNFSTSTPTASNGKKGPSAPPRRAAPLSTKNDVDLTTELVDPDPEPEGNKVVAKHLSAHEPFRNSSPEEIRLEDYQAAASRTTDPLRRDAGVSSKCEPPRRHPKLRREWLDREVEISTSAGASGRNLSESRGEPGVHKAAVARESGRAEVGSQPAGSRPEDPPGEAAPTPHTTSETATDSGDPGCSSGQLLSGLSALPSCSEFTFRMEKPPRDDADQDAALPRKHHFTAAAVAALAEQAAQLDLTAGAPPKLPGSVTTPSKASELRGDQVKDKEKHEGDIFFIKPVPRTAEIWAARVRDGSDNSTAAPQTKEQDSDDQGGDWPFRVKPEPTVITAMRWFDWKPGPDDPGFSSHDQASQEGEKHQMTLLQLIALAEKLCWDDLFNEAMNAYLDGERLMNRRLVSLAHLEVAYTKCCATSPLRRFLCDMVHFEAKTCLTHSQYLEFAQMCDDFLADLFRRLDGQSWSSGKHPFAKLKNPLNVRRCAYHYHTEWSGHVCF